MQSNKKVHYKVAARKLANLYNNQGYDVSVGQQYAPEKSLREIAKEVRAMLKSKFSGVKLNLSHSTRGRSKNLTVMIEEFPRNIPVFENGFLEYVRETGDADQVAYSHWASRHVSVLTYEAEELIKSIEASINAWRRTESDYQTDLYNTNFFLRVTVDIEALKKNHLNDELKRYEVDQAKYASVKTARKVEIEDFIYDLVKKALRGVREAMKGAKGHWGPHTTKNPDVSFFVYRDEIGFTIDMSPNGEMEEFVEEMRYIDMMNDMSYDEHLDSLGDTIDWYLPFDMNVFNRSLSSFSRFILDTEFVCSSWEYYFNIRLDPRMISLPLSNQTIDKINNRLRRL